MTKGFIAGSFDVIHPGYISMFLEAYLSCDYLIVALQEDPTIDRPDKLKPILDVKERELILLSFKYVDEVHIYKTEQDLYNLLVEIKPDVRYLGDDYMGKDYTGSDLEMDVYYTDRSHGWSTTKFKEEIYNQIKNRQS